MFARLRRRGMLSLRGTSRAGGATRCARTSPAAGDARGAWRRRRPSAPRPGARLACRRTGARAPLPRAREGGRAQPRKSVTFPSAWRPSSCERLCDRVSAIASGVPPFPSVESACCAPSCPPPSGEAPAAPCRPRARCPSRAAASVGSSDRIESSTAMKITSVRATWVHVPIPAERQHTSDFGKIASFDSVIVKIDTDAGHVGWGEAKASVGSAASGFGLAAIINQDYAPLLVGQDPRDISRLWDVMYNTPREGYAVSRGHVLPQLGRRGLSISAIGGVDIALWDILGKSLNAPVWRLLGGRRAARMPAYASGGWADESRIGEQLMSYVKAGFRAVKMRVGVMDGDPHHSAARVHAARAAVGPDIKLMADAHGTWTVAEAKAFCRLVEDDDLYWPEERGTADAQPRLAQA